MVPSLPAYPDSRPLELADRSWLTRLCRELQPVISELCFANLYLFRHIHHYRLTRVENSFILLAVGYDGASYFLPPLSGDRTSASRRLLASGVTLYGADDRFLAELAPDAACRIEADRDNFDYLYNRSDLADLPGRAFHKKNNRIIYFIARHQFLVEVFSPEHQAGALALLAEWQRAHLDEDSRSLAAELEATREGIELAAQLGLQGVTILVDGRVAAFALGEQLSDTTFVCHFEKSAPFSEGLAQLVNREFCRSLPTDCRFVNREQDLGIDGLRKAKTSYHPVALIRKYRITGPASTLR